MHIYIDIHTRIRVWRGVDRWRAGRAKAGGGLGVDDGARVCVGEDELPQSVCPVHVLAATDMNAEKKRKRKKYSRGGGR